MGEEFTECREVVERIKDILSTEIEGFIFDRHVAEELDIPHITMRINIMKNRLPLKQIALFCYKRNIILNELIFKK